MANGPWFACEPQPPAAQRNWPGNHQTIEVRVNGQLVGTVTPAGLGYAEYTTAAFTIAAGDHTVELQGLGLTGDHTAFVDAVRIVAAPAPVNASFETPPLGASFQTRPSGPEVAWTFIGDAGIAGNQSDFTSGNPNAPEGTQVAFLQHTGAMQQLIAGWAAGSYTIRFDAAQRGNWTPSTQMIEVRVNGQLVDTIAPVGIAYREYTTAAFTVAVGDHIVELQGLGPSGDHTAFVDAVRIEPLLGPPQPSWTAYDGVNPYADFDGSGTLQTRYLHGPAVDWLLARSDASGETDWYLTDRLGSVRQIVDGDGDILYEATYNGFGRRIATSGSGGDRHGYTGRELDAESRQQYNRGRFYDATIGRWTQEDPIGLIDDTNLYRYVGNSPTNFIDPLGLYGWGAWTVDFLGALPGAVRDTFVSGEACDSARGMINATTDALNPFGGGIPIGPKYGHQQAYASGQSVGRGTGLAMNTVLTVGGVRGVVTGARAIQTSGGMLPVIQLSTPYGKSVYIISENGRAIVATADTLAALGVSGAGAANVMACMSTGSGGQNAPNATEQQKFLRRAKLGGEVDSAKNVHLFDNRNLTVREYIAQYRKGGIKEVLPSEAADMTVEQALRAGKVGDVNVRKLLLDTRDKFVK